MPENHPFLWSYWIVFKQRLLLFSSSRVRIFSYPKWQRFQQIFLQNMMVILIWLELITLTHLLPRNVLIRYFPMQSASDWRLIRMLNNTQNENLKSFAYFMDSLFGLENSFRFLQWDWNFNTLPLLFQSIFHFWEYSWHIIFMKWK